MNTTRPAVVERHPAVWVEEIYRTTYCRWAHTQYVWNTDIPWGLRRFRPVLKRNVEIIESLLQPVKEDA